MCMQTGGIIIYKCKFYIMNAKFTKFKTRLLILFCVITLSIKTTSDAFLPFTCFTVVVKVRTGWSEGVCAYVCT